MKLASGHIWFIFGESSDGKHVDIADAEDMNLFEFLPRELAKEICEKHNNAIWDMEERANRVSRKVLG